MHRVGQKHGRPGALPEVFRRHGDRAPQGPGPVFLGGDTHNIGSGQRNTASSPGRRIEARTTDPTREPVTLRSAILAGGTKLARIRLALSGASAAQPALALLRSRLAFLTARFNALVAFFCLA